ATQPATSIDPVTTQPSYWLQQPAQSVTANDFDRLWNVCEEAARDFLFSIDRTDYRAGLLTTRPLTSRQWFEVWRPDVRTIPDLDESATATIRRTIRFEFERRADGTFTVAPKVLVERQSVAEQRITSVVSYRGMFTPPIKRREQPKGTHETDVGLVYPS